MSSLVKDEIHEALELLEEAAKDTAVELGKLIKDQYPNLQKMLLDDIYYIRDSFDSIQEGVRERATRLKEASRKTVKHVASQVDGEIQHHPWHYIGGMAISALLLGYILGKKSGS